MCYFSFFATVYTVTYIHGYMDLQMLLCGRLLIHSVKQSSQISMLALSY